jgi:DNA-binding IclR family transcriptional regulator
MTRADAIEAAVLAAIGRVGVGWLPASGIAARIGFPPREVARALSDLATRGLVDRRTEWADDRITATWCVKGRSR